MVTLGDVWALTAAVTAMAACTWALLLCLSILFPARSDAAKEAIERSPLKLIGIGLVLSLIFGAAGLALLSAPQPAVKFIGWIVLLALFAVSFSGSAGVVRLAAERLQGVEQGMGAYGALSRGTLLVVLPCILPIVGWFLFAPIVFVIGVGAGISRRPRLDPIAA